MKTHHLRTEVRLPAPRETVFRFFADPRNLQRITPDWLHFELLTPETAVSAGARLDYRLKLRGIPLRWQSEISVWEPPHRFVDRQIKGPYSLWVHEHTFREENGGTLVGDHVEYAALGGPLVKKFLIEPDLQRIFRHRRRVLQEIFFVDHSSASGSWDPIQRV
jgi:ligand-binding SRPBCC domain-containing protein